MGAPLDNAAVAERLEAFGGLLDLAGASPYTARAYRRAAETIRETRAPIVELVRQRREQELRGIGQGIASKLRELVETGTIAELDELRREVRPELVGLGRLLGIAPKRVVEIASVLGPTRRTSDTCTPPSASRGVRPSSARARFEASLQL